MKKGLPIIPLDRRFFEWRSEGDQLSDPDALSRFGLSDSAKAWDEILKRRRVVILAEAGSGKSEELKNQQRVLAGEGKFSFYATVEDVAREGLDLALLEEDRPRLANWRSSKEPAWFFIDSIDEAKIDGVRLDRALGKIADGIRNAEGRAHIVLSGRHTDWEFRRDLKRLEELLPLKPVGEAPIGPTSDELLIKTLRHEPLDEKVSEAKKSLVVVLASLDKERVRRFAIGKGGPSIDALLAEIDALNLWRFARRPIDLDWLVQFWKTYNRLGSLTDMLATSLRERLRETDPIRDRRDPIDVDHAGEALERVGAALVFGRASTICIPDNEIVLADDPSSLDLNDILPDWPGNDRIRLLNRPVFDPATFGRVRLHNDNEGAVRGYLAARWLKRLHDKNLSRHRLFDLLFAESYGIQIVKPSLQETAAWLSLWVPEVAREVIDREPYLLLTGGDPGSLPAEVRGSVLTRLVERMIANDEALPILDYDSVKRFSRPDIAQIIKQLWSAHKSHKEVRDLLLRIVWLGAITECADMAKEALITCGNSDRHDRLVSGRAFMAVAGSANKRLYADRVVAECGTLPPSIVWDAVEALFPSIITVDELLTILRSVDVTNHDGGVGFQWQSADLIKRVESAADLERLLRGLLEILGETSLGSPREPGDREETFVVAISAAAYVLMLKSADQTAPTIAIDAGLRIGRYLRYQGRGASEKIEDAAAELRRTSLRRRLAFWRAAERLSGDRFLHGRPIESPWEMEVLGWSPGLTADDLEWLLSDAPSCPSESEQRLAINAALSIWGQIGKPDGIRDRVRSVAEANPVMVAAYDAWMNPPPANRALEESERELKRLQRQNALAQARRDKSWIKFVEKLRRDPDQLRHLNPATREGVDARLFHLWQLLSSAVQSNTRHAIESVTPVEPVLGSDLALALRDGLIRYWRTWEPTARSARANRNSMSSVDAMGIAGVSMEAHGASEMLARRAVVYATLEMNGFPTWLSDVSARWPAQVREVLLREIISDLDSSQERYGVLYDLSRTDSTTVQLMCPALLSELDRRPNLAGAMLRPLLNVLERTPSEIERARLLALSTERFSVAPDLETAGLYIGMAFCIDQTIATETLLNRLDRLNPEDQTRLAQAVLPDLFGDGFPRERPAISLSLQSLERLVCAAFQTIRVQEDNYRADGRAYTPDSRDNAERARGAAFMALTKIPGRATFNAILGFAAVLDFPIPHNRLRALARERAATDSEMAKWLPGEACAFEDKCEALPRTPFDLQRLMLSRLVDLQEDLVHGDFAQGATLRSLPLERDVQNFVADRLRGVRGRSYSVERESHVVDEKEPDIRIRSSTNSSVPIEIKVAESWTLEQLIEALVTQLCGQYLRARGARHGILLLVHQNSRSKGWNNPRDGRRLTFPEVVELLRSMCREIAGSDTNAPQPEVGVIDVSTCGAELKKRAGKKRSGKKRPSKKHLGRKHPGRKRSSKARPAKRKLSAAKRGQKRQPAFRSSGGGRR